VLGPVVTFEVALMREVYLAVGFNDTQILM